MVLQEEGVEAVEAEAGIFFWQVQEDLLYGDTAVADLFGLEPGLTAKGLPLSTYLARVFPPDKSLLAAEISQAINSGHSYHAEYRVMDTRGEVRQVVALGRCFRDANGEPAHYAGIVYPIDRLE